MTSLNETDDKASLQVDLDELALQLKVWENILETAIPQCQPDMSSDTLLDQCTTVGSIYEQMMGHQLRLLSLQLSSHLPGFLYNENVQFYSNLGNVSMQWRELFIRLCRWLAQVQTEYLKSDGMMRHCREFEKTLREFGDMVYLLQQKSLTSDEDSAGVHPVREVERLKDLLNKYSARMMSFKMSLSTMRFGSITTLRDRQLEGIEERMLKTEKVLDQARERFWQCVRRMGMENVSNDKKSRIPVVHRRRNFLYQISKPDRTKEKRTRDQEMQIDISSLSEMNASLESDPYKDSKGLHAPPPSPRRSRQKPSKQFLGIITTSLTVDIFFFILLIFLLFLVCPTCDRVILWPFLNPTGLSWTKRWTDVPPS